jgi:hypothetical protein
MGIYLEVQVETAIHRFVMKDRETAIEILRKLQPHIGRPRFSRNSDEANFIQFESEDGTAILSLECIHAARITDWNVFEAENAERRKKRYAEARELDVELITRLAR